MPEEFSSEEFWLEAAQKFYGAFNYVPEAMRTEVVRHAAEAVCLTAVQQTGLALAYVPEALKTEALCLEAMKHMAISSESGDLGGYGVGLIKSV